MNLAADRATAVLIGTVFEIKLTTFPNKANKRKSGAPTYLPTASHGETTHPKYKPA